MPCGLIPPVVFAIVGNPVSFIRADMISNIMERRDCRSVLFAESLGRKSHPRSPSPEPRIHGLPTPAPPKSRHPAGVRPRRNSALMLS